MRKLVSTVVVLALVFGLSALFVPTPIDASTDDKDQGINKGKGKKCNPLCDPFGGCPPCMEPDRCNCCKKIPGCDPNNPPPSR